jgi:hypothetical protein
MGISLCAFFYRVKARAGWGKAAMAVAHKILAIAYSILKTEIPYQDLGGNHFDGYGELPNQPECAGFEGLIPLPECATSLS